MLVNEIYLTSKLTSLVFFALASMMTLLAGVTDGVVVGEGRGMLLALFLECFRFLAWACVMFSGTIFEGSASAS
jgi:hypothetical protein